MTDLKDVVKKQEFDGIQEYNNPLPRWWLITFIGTVIFAFGYWVFYHTFEIGITPEQELEKQKKIVAAKEEKSAAMVTEDMLMALAKDPEAVTRGKAVFSQNCVACHGDKGQGVIGPNLTDAYWIHGGKPMEIHKVVSFGVPEKGMIAWKNALSAKTINDVVAYILTIKNTNIAGKPPQGDKQE